MLDDINLEEDLTDNEASYEGLVSTIALSQGMLGLIIASCTAGAFQDELIDRYETALAPSIPSYRIKLESSEPSLRAAIETLVNQHPELQDPHAAAVITVTGAASLLSVKLRETESNSELDRFFGYLQWTREGLREFPYPIVLWVTPRILRQLSVKSPDFWSWRTGVFRFVSPIFMHNSVDFRGGTFPSFEANRPTDLPLDELLEQAAQIEAQHPQSLALSTLYDRLGQAYENQIIGDQADNRGRAIEYFQRSLQIPTTRRSNQLNTLIRLGNLYRRLGYYNEAEEIYLQCLDIETELGNRAGIASSWGVLGDIARDRGDYEKAESLYLQSLELRTELGDQTGIAISWGCLGDIARYRGDYDKAASLYIQSLELHTELGDRAGIATSWGVLGENELEKGELVVAEMWLKKALSAMEELQMTWYIAETNWDLARLYRARNDIELAQQYYNTSYQLSTQLGAKKEIEKIEREWNIQKL